MGYAIIANSYFFGVGESACSNYPNSVHRRRSRSPVPKTGKVALALLFIQGWLTLSAALALDPATSGQWSSVMDWPCEAIHGHLLPTGEVLFWQRSGPPGDNNNAQLWDPVTNRISSAPNCAANVFCSGHAFLPDGHLFVAGGHITTWVGRPDAYSFDPFKNSWSRLPDMNNGRWYPTVTTLPNGDMLVTAGSMGNGTGNNLEPQVWQRASGTWRNLSTALLNVPIYPPMFVAPNGKVFMAGPRAPTRYLDPSGTGRWSLVANTQFGLRNTASCVMYDDGKVLVTGGTSCNYYGTCQTLPTATAEIIDLNSATPAWKYTGELAVARKLHNGTLLPDGKVLVTGGTQGSEDPNTNSANPAYAAEMWDPTTGLWRTMASTTVFRGYHSVALLLPDGRVLSAGGDFGGASAEVYSPPYLFQGARPSIASAPGSVVYGQRFVVGTPDAASISSVTMVALSSVTHSVNMNQRISKPAFSKTNGGLTLTAPSNPNTTPPGYYMLFILNGSGVPSVARILSISGTASSPTPTPTATPTPVPAAPTNLLATAGSPGAIDLSWTDNADNESGFKIERSTDGLTFTQIATIGPNLTAHTDTGLAPAIEYQYRLRAYNSGGDSTYSNTASATTAPSATPTPTPSGTPAPTATPTQTPAPAGARLSGMTVVTAPAGMAVVPLTDGYDYDLKNNLSVRADPISGVDSVVFKLDGVVVRTESVVPYSVAGDDNGVYAAWRPSVGDHVLVAIPYGLPRGGGQAGTPVTVNFKVVN